MSRHLRTRWIAIGLIYLTAFGCTPTQPFYFGAKDDLSHYIGMATKIEQPDVKQASLMEATNPLPPLSLANTKYDSIWELTLQDAIHITLENSKVMRTLGGRFSTTGGTRPQVGDAPTILQTSPQSVLSVYDPALTETNVGTGVEGAYRSIDATLSSSFHVAAREPAGEHFRNPRVARRDAKRHRPRCKPNCSSGPSGGIVSVYRTRCRIQTEQHLPRTHDNETPSTLASPSGCCAGPARFQPNPRTAGRQLAGERAGGVQLQRRRHFANQHGHQPGPIRGRTCAIWSTTWKTPTGNFIMPTARWTPPRSAATALGNVARRSTPCTIVNAKGGEADKEAQAREQYFNFRGQVEQALTDLYRIENRLRYLMGLAATDGRLIRPKDEPTTASVVFDWHCVHEEGLDRSVELRQGKMADQAARAGIDGREKPAAAELGLHRQLQAVRPGRSR